MELQLSDILLPGIAPSVVGGREDKGCDKGSWQYRWHWGSRL